VQEGERGGVEGWGLVKGWGVKGRNKGGWTECERGGK